MGNAEVKVTNDLNEAIEVNSYNYADTVYWSAHETKTISPGSYETLHSAGQEIVKLKGTYKGRTYGPYSAQSGSSHKVSEIFGIEVPAKIVKPTKIIQQKVPANNFREAADVTVFNSFISPAMSSVVHNQGKSSLCWAFSSETLIRAAQFRASITQSDHDKTVSELEAKYGKGGNYPHKILPEEMKARGLNGAVIPITPAKAVVICIKRPLLLNVFLTKNQWTNFSTFFRSSKTKGKMIFAKDMGPSDGEVDGHAMVVESIGVYETKTGENGTYFKIKNSWGEGWGDGGYCRADKDAFPSFDFFDIKIDCDK